MGDPLHRILEALGRASLQQLAGRPRRARYSGISLSASSGGQPCRTAGHRHSGAGRGLHERAFSLATLALQKARVPDPKETLRRKQVRREERKNKASRRFLATSAAQLGEEEEIQELMPTRESLGISADQLRESLATCLELYREVAKPDATWVRELVQPILAEFDKRRREQQATLQRLIARYEKQLLLTERRSRLVERSAKPRRLAAGDAGDSVEASPAAHRAGSGYRGAVVVGASSGCDRGHGGHQFKHQTRRRSAAATRPATTGNPLKQ